jgi:hypothetical protein
VSQFVTVLSICMIAGIAFLIVSLIALGRLPASVTPNGEVMVCWNGVTLKTNSVYVGLVVVSALFGLVMPGLMLVESSKSYVSTVKLPIRFDDVPDGTVAVSQGTQDLIASPLVLTLFRSDEWQHYVVSSKTREIQIDARYEPNSNQLRVHVGGGAKEQFLAIKGQYADELDDVRFPIATIRAMPTIAARRNAHQPAVSRSLASLPDPTLPGPSR